MEWQPALAVLLGAEQTVFRGHQGVREWIQEVDEAVAELQFEVSEIRDPGNSVLSIGRTRVLKKESRVPIETPFFALADYRDGKAIRLRTYFHLTEALEAAGLQE